MRVKVTGLNELNGFLRGLNRNLRKEMNKEGYDFLKAVKRSAKLRAPRNTGYLAEHIFLTQEKGGISTLVVDSRQGVFQEEGFRPHWIPRSWIAGNEGQKGMVFVQKNTPFLAPALEHNLSKLSQRMSDATDRAFKGGRR